MTKYYFDTYALIETGKSNPNYLKYLKGSTIVLHKLNLMELAYFLKREGKEETAKTLFAQLKKYHAEASDSAFIKAAMLKYQFKERRLSYIDCLGYQI
ncbi:hypothetical protein HYU12_00915 [Candidatus Woesearchaeota archaeon]|nr:hypothetical protein [Candidatus Woesearchaeota archaeon]